MWLLSRGRVKEAEAVVRRVARINRKTLPDVIFDEEDIKEQMVSGTPIPDVKYLQAFGPGDVETCHPGIVAVVHGFFIFVSCRITAVSDVNLSNANIKYATQKYLKWKRL